MSAPPKRRHPPTPVWLICLIVSGGLFLFACSVPVMWVAAGLSRPGGSYLQHQNEVRMGMGEQKIISICGQPDRRQFHQDEFGVRDVTLYYDGGRSQLVFKWDRLESVNVY